MMMRARTPPPMYMSFLLVGVMDRVRFGANCCPVIPTRDTG